MASRRTAFQNSRPTFALGPALRRRSARSHSSTWTGLPVRSRACAVKADGHLRAEVAEAVDEFPGHAVSSQGHQDGAADLSAFDDAKVRELADDPRRARTAHAGDVRQNGDPNLRFHFGESSEEPARGSGNHWFGGLAVVHMFRIANINVPLADVSRGPPRPTPANIMPTDFGLQEPEHTAERGLRMA